MIAGGPLIPETNTVAIFHPLPVFAQPHACLGGETGVHWRYAQGLSTRRRDGVLGQVAHLFDHGRSAEDAGRRGEV